MPLRCCYSLLLKDSHQSIEKAMHHNCAVCFEVILVGKESLLHHNVHVMWSSLFICAVSFWHNQRHYCLAMWSHHTFGMCERDGTTFAVSYTTEGSCTYIEKLLLYLDLNICTVQVFMPGLLKVFLWYVTRMEETRWGGNFVLMI